VPERFDIEFETHDFQKTHNVTAKKKNYDIANNKVLIEYIIDNRIGASFCYLMICPINNSINTF